MYKSEMKRLVTTVEVGKPFSYRSVDRQLVVGEQGKGEASRRPYLYVVDRTSCPCHCESSNWHGPNGAIRKAETPGKRRCDGTRNAKKNNRQSSHIGLRDPSAVIATGRGGYDVGTVPIWHPRGELGWALLADRRGLISETSHTNCG